MIIRRASSHHSSEPELFVGIPPVPVRRTLRLAAIIVFVLANGAFAAAECFA